MTPPALHRSRIPHGFSLVELLVVVAILGVLLGLTLPAVQMAREAARKTQCSSKLRQIGLAIHRHHDLHGLIPAGREPNSNESQFPYMSWLTRLLPYLEQESLWSDTLAAYAMNRIPFHNADHYMFQVPIAAFACPSDSRVQHTQYSRGRLVAMTSYVGVWGRDIDHPDGTLYLDSRLRLGDITDGTSNTLIVGERPPSKDMWYGWWYAGDGIQGKGNGDMLLGVREINHRDPDTASCPAGPYEFEEGSHRNQCHLFHFWSLHPRGAYFLSADGAVRFLAYEANDVLPALASRAGGETAQLP